MKNKIQITSFIACIALGYCVKWLNEPHEWNEMQTHNDSVAWVKNVDSAKLEQQDSIYADSIGKHYGELGVYYFVNLVTSDTAHTTSWLTGGDIWKWGEK